MRIRYNPYLHICRFAFRWKRDSHIRITLSMLDQLKGLIQNGERYIVVEGGKPEYVLMRFQDYALLLSGRKGNPGPAGSGDDRSGDWQSVNAVLEEVGAREPYAAPEFGVAPEPRPAAPDPTTIRLEDLPL